MKRSFIIILFFFYLLHIAKGQEVLIGLSENPVIKNSNEKPSLLKSLLQRPKSLELPFLEDFKQQSIYPDTALWMDNHVFINNDYPLFPPTWNVATFDAIDAHGNIYPQANPLYFIADYLTSKPIRLDSIFSPAPASLSPADSVIFSFFYQPQGRANDPQPVDSLVLEFGYYANDSTSAWQRVWATEGMTLDSFLVLNNDQYFRQIRIPIVDSVWFRDDFQFRFYNYASIASDNLQSWQSNCDQWNIDFVYLNRNRSILDSTHKAISFVGSAPSFLKDYQSMPYYQYKNSDPSEMLKLSLEMLISNLDNSSQTAEYYYEVRNDQGNLQFDWIAGAFSLAPFYLSGYTTYPQFAFPPVAGVFPPYGDRDSIHFDIVHYLEGDVELGFADTLRFRQKFFNYYAYDDGTPEYGYGLTPTGARLAYRFMLSRRDTLRAVKMFFNKTFTGANDRFFDLAVWDDLNGLPGDIIYVQERERPQFSDELNKFHTYLLDEPVPVQGTFYVGWIQRSEHNLNVGFDAGNDASGNIFYYVTDEWLTSSYSGALMIRPVLGKKLIDEPLEKSSLSENFVIAPNPSRDGLINLKFFVFDENGHNKQFIDVDPDELKQIKLEVFNLMGQKVYNDSFSYNLDLGNLRKGIYLLRLTDLRNRNSMIQKLVISN
jgi:hypothetical protein